MILIKKIFREGGGGGQMKIIFGYSTFIEQYPTVVICPPHFLWQKTNDSMELLF